MKFNIYIPSYKRYNDTTVYKNLEYCTYVIRKSEEPYYKKLGVNLLAVEDDKINSFTKVQNYLIENAPEDVICVIDDDVESFVYRLDKSIKINI